MTQQIPYAITNQPWLIKHIMAYHPLSYIKQDKAKHKNKINEVHKELSDYNYANSYWNYGDEPVDEIYTLGRPVIVTKNMIHRNRDGSEEEYKERYWTFKAIGKASIDDFAIDYDFPGYEYEKN